MNLSATNAPLELVAEDELEATAQRTRLNVSIYSNIQISNKILWMIELPTWILE